MTAQFRIGGVYRQRGGTIVCLRAIDPDNYKTGYGDKVAPSVVRAALEKWSNHGPLAHAAYADGVGDDGWRRLSDGRYPDSDDDDYRSHLLPGELHNVNGQWVPVAEEAPKTAKSRPGIKYICAVPEGLAVTPADLHMVARDQRPPAVLVAPKFDPWKGFFTEPADIADWQDTYFPR